MAKDAVLAFLKKAREDEVLQEKLVALASEHGYDFSVEELTDLELDTAVGGAGYVKFETVAGESTDKDHDKWIEIRGDSGSTLTKP